MTRRALATYLVNGRGRGDLPKSAADLFRTERFITFPNSKLREVVTRTVFEEKSGGLRFAKDQPIKIDLMTALSMACLACVERSSKSGYRLDVIR